MEISYVWYKEILDNQYETVESVDELSYLLVFIALHSSLLLPFTGGTDC